MSRQIGKRNENKKLKEERTKTVKRKEKKVGANYIFSNLYPE